MKDIFSGWESRLLKRERKSCFPEDAPAAAQALANIMIFDEDDIWWFLQALTNPCNYKFFDSDITLFLSQSVHKMKEGLFSGYTLVHKL